MTFYSAQDTDHYGHEPLFLFALYDYTMTEYAHINV